MRKCRLIKFPLAINRTNASKTRKIRTILYKLEKYLTGFESTFSPPVNNSNFSFVFLFLFDEKSIPSK